MPLNLTASEALFWIDLHQVQPAAENVESQEKVKKKRQVQIIEKSSLSE